MQTNNVFITLKWEHFEITSFSYEDGYDGNLIGYVSRINCLPDNAINCLTSLIRETLKEKLNWFGDMLIKIEPFDLVRSQSPNLMQSILSENSSWVGSWSAEVDSVEDWMLIRLAISTEVSLRGEMIDLAESLLAIETNNNSHKSSVGILD